MAAKSYFISTPYVDAYSHDWEPDHPKLTYDEFVKAMQRQAYQWGEMGIGRAAIDGRGIPMHGGEYVLAFGTHGGKKYLATATGQRFEPRVVEVSDIPNEWDAT
jgi:hypothetical protein